MAFSAMNFGTMVTRVGELIHQDVSDDTNPVTNTMVKANLNIGYRKVISAVVSINQNFYVRKSTADLVEDQEMYHLPDDCRKLVRLEIGYSTSTDLRLAEAIDMNEVGDPLTGFSEGAPYYSAIGNQVRVYPTPTAAVTDGLVFWYVEMIEEMSGSTDTPDLPLGYDHLPLVYATAKAKLVLGLTDEHDRMMGEFMGEIETMKDEVVERNIGTHDRVVVMDY